MPLLKLILAGLLALGAVLAGLFATLLVAVTGLVYFFSRRLFRSRRTPPPQARTSAARPTRARDDAIEVIATEVSATEIPATEEPANQLADRLPR